MEASKPEHYQVMITGNEMRKLAFKQNDVWTIIDGPALAECYVKESKATQSELSRLREENVQQKEWLEAYKESNTEFMKSTIDQKFEIERLREENEELRKENEAYKFCLSEENKKIWEELRKDWPNLSKKIRF